MPRSGLLISLDRSSGKPQSDGRAHGERRAQPAAMEEAGQWRPLSLRVIRPPTSAVALRPLTRDLGQRRIGDLLASTQVVDGSIALGLGLVAPRDASPAAAPLVSSRAARERVKPRPGPGTRATDAGLHEEACASP